eukprot:6478656-Amphidinium_carterae.1
MPKVHWHRLSAPHRTREKSQEAFVIKARREELDYMRTLKVWTQGRLGPEAGDLKEVRVLTRRLTWHARHASPERIEKIANSRHEKLLQSQLGMNAKSTTLSCILSSPGVTVEVNEETAASNSKIEIWPLPSAKMCNSNAEVAPSDLRSA